MRLLNESMYAMILVFVKRPRAEPQMTEIRPYQ
jgi:hypothetical protein